MITYTTDDLVTAVKGLAHVPQAQVTFQPVDLLRLADSAMRTIVSPKIVSVREGYWTTFKDYSLVASTSPLEIPIPSLALGSALIDVKLLVGDIYLPVDRIEISELVSQANSPRSKYGYWVEDNILKFLSNGNTNGTLRLWYNRMPSQLVVTTACGLISGVSGNNVTVSSLPSTFQLGVELDIVSGTPGFNVVLKDSAPTAINTTTLTFSTVSSRVKIGDYVCLSGQSCVVQAPIEWIAVLEQATACKIYESQGYLQKLAAADKTLKEQIANVISLINPRQIQKSKYISAGGQLLGVTGRKRPFAA